MPVSRKPQLMSENYATPPREGVERAVLKHTEAIPAAIICALLLALSVRELVSVIRAQSGADLISLDLFWGICSIALLVFLARAVMGTTVVRKHNGQLTISVSVGPLALWNVKSVPLAELENMVIQERTYGYIGKKMHRYVMLYGRDGTQEELLKFLSRGNVLLLVHGVLREFFAEEPVI